MILHNRFRRNDQCYLDFNKETEGLLLPDISENNDTQLYDPTGEQRPQISKTRPQCVVVLSPDPYSPTTAPATASGSSKSVTLCFASCHEEHRAKIKGHLLKRDWRLPTNTTRSGRLKGLCNDLSLWAAIHTIRDNQASIASHLQSPQHLVPDPT